MPNAERDDAIIVAVTRDGSFFLSPGNKKIGADALAGNVKDSLAGRLDKTIYLCSDARAKYGDVVKAVDEVRAVGVDSIGLLTEKIQQKAAPPRGGSD